MSKIRLGIKYKDCKRNRIKIKCIETNEIFNSLYECGIKINLDNSKLSQIIKGKRKSTKGFHFEKIIE